MEKDEKMKIKEIIVVEGKDDTAAVQRAVDADTIETNGSAPSAWKQLKKSNWPKRRAE